MKCEEEKNRQIGIFGWQVREFALIFLFSLKNDQEMAKLFCFSLPKQWKKIWFYMFTSHKTGKVYIFLFSLSKWWEKLIFSLFTSHLTGFFLFPPFFFPKWQNHFPLDSATIQRSCHAVCSWVDDQGGRGVSGWLCNWPLWIYRFILPTRNAGTTPRHFTFPSHGFPPTASLPRLPSYSFPSFWDSFTRVMRGRNMHWTFLFVTLTPRGGAP